MKKLIVAMMGILIFATINPHQVSAETLEPPKVFVDGIVSAADHRISPVQLLQHKEYKQFALMNVSQPTVAQSAVIPRSPVSGNLYTAGNCTWYAKSRRPDLPNNLGNADTWYDRAAAQGIPVGSTPRVGAVGMTRAYMHVVYIESISGDSVTVSEMNYVGLGVVSSRTAPASEFLYIY